MSLIDLLDPEDRSATGEAHRDVVNINKKLCEVWENKTHQSKGLLSKIVHGIATGAYLAGSITTEYNMLCYVGLGMGLLEVTNLSLGITYKIDVKRDKSWLVLGYGLSVAIAFMGAGILIEDLAFEEIQNYIKKTSLLSFGIANLCSLTGTYIDNIISREDTTDSL